ncbi:MAG: hypothetical protein MRY72_12260 [Aquisalinus sp.]|nr:hypothetical protein [Aquisalinus sp.]
MQTETLDKLYLEWSQYTGARTGREIALAGALEQLLNYFDANYISQEVAVALQQHRATLNRNR